MSLLKKLLELVKETLIEIKDAYLYALKSKNKLVKVFFGFVVPFYLVVYLIASFVSGLTYIISLFISCMIIIYFIKKAME
jgi:hypothetical protein